jgi:hypothetical protein
MKPLFGTLALLFGLLAFGQAQIPNGSFDTWIGNIGGAVPKGWTPKFMDSVKAVSNAYDGPVGAGISTYPSFEGTQPNTLSNGFRLDNNTPSRFRGYVKTATPGEDTVYIRVTLYNQGKQTFQDVWKTTKTYNSWQKVTLNMGNVNSDSASITLTAGCCVTDLGGTADPETRLIADAFSFDAEVGLPENPKKRQFSLYPNPAAEQVNLQGFQTDKALQYRLTNNQGQVLQTGSIRQGDSTIRLEGLPSGLYLIQLHRPGTGDDPQNLRLFATM